MAKGKVASVFVSLGLDTAAFSSNWEKATRLGMANAKELERSFKLIGNAVLGMSTAAVAGLGLLVKQQIDVADHAKKMSEKFGVSVEALTGFSHAAKLSGIDTETLGIGLKKLTKWMVENGQGGRDVKEVLLEVADSYQKMGEGAARSADAQKKFGKSGTDLIPMLKDGRAGLQGMWEEAGRLGLVISGKTAAAAEEFNDNLTRLRAILTGVATQIMTANIPALTALSRMFVEISPTAQRAGGDIADSFGNKVVFAIFAAQGAMESYMRFLKKNAAGIFPPAMFIPEEIVGPGTGLDARLNDAILVIKSWREAMDNAAKGGRGTGGVDPAFAEATAKAAKAIKEFIENLKEQSFAHGKTAAAINLHKAALLGITDPKILNDIKNLSVALEKFGGKAVTPKKILDVEILPPQIFDLDKLDAWAKLPTIFGQIRDAAVSVKPPLSEMAIEMRQFSQYGLQAIGDAALGLTSWKNVARQILSDLGRMLWYMLIVKPLMNSIFSFGGGGGVPTASFADMVSLGQVSKPFAAGGSFEPGRMITVGERGPELLFTGNQSGAVLSNAASRGLGGGVTQHINIDNRGADFGTMAKTAALIARLVNERTLERMADRASRTV